MKVDIRVRTFLGLLLLIFPIKFVHAFFPTFDVTETVNTISTYTTQVQNVSASVQSALSVDKIKQAIGDSVGSISKFTNEEEKAAEAQEKIEKKRRRAERLQELREEWEETYNNAADLYNTTKDAIDETQDAIEGAVDAGQELIDEGTDFYEEASDLYNRGEDLVDGLVGDSGSSNSGSSNGSSNSGSSNSGSNSGSSNGSSNSGSGDTVGDNDHSGGIDSFEDVNKYNKDEESENKKQEETERTSSGEEGTEEQSESKQNNNNEYEGVVRRPFVNNSEGESVTPSDIREGSTADDMKVSYVYTHSSAFAQMNSTFKTGTNDYGKFIYSDIIANKCNMNFDEISEEKVAECVKTWVLGMQHENAEVAKEWKEFYKDAKHDHVASDVNEALEQKNYAANFEIKIADDLDQKAEAVTNEREEVSFSGQVSQVNQEIIIRLMEAQTSQALTDAISAISFLYKEYYGEEVGNE